MCCAFMQLCILFGAVFLTRTLVDPDSVVYIQASMLAASNNYYAFEAAPPLHTECAV